MKKIFVLAIMAAFLAPVTASAFEVVIPYFVDNAVIDLASGSVEQAGWTTIVKLVNNTDEDLYCGIRYTGSQGLNATPAGNTFELLALSGWPFRPCQDVRGEEGNKVAPGTPLVSGDPDPVDPGDQRHARGPRGPLSVVDEDLDGYFDEDGDETSFVDSKGALAIYIVDGAAGWDLDADGPPISVIVETITTAPRYNAANGISSVSGVQGAPGTP